jgi:hypothetical protein
MSGMSEESSSNANRQAAYLPAETTNKSALDSYEADRNYSTLPQELLPHEYESRQRIQRALESQEKEFTLERLRINYSD